MNTPPTSNPADAKQSCSMTGQERDVARVEEQTSGKAPISPILSGHRPGRARRRAALSAGATIVLLGGFTWYWQAASFDHNATNVAADMGAPFDQMLTIEPQPVSAQIDIAGTISAGRSVAIVAPFDGVIREKRVQLGDHVEAGTVLVVMDTSEIAGRFRDAQSAYLKAAMAAQAMEKWESSSDVLRSRRAVDAAQNVLDALERQMAGLKSLLDQGIISRNEYESVVQQRDAQRNTVESAKDDLSATLDRGNADNRQLVALDLENTQSRLRDLKAQMAGAEVATAIAGILTRPPAGAKGHEPISVDPGANVSRGAALFSIADTSSFTVTGAVDEVDVNRVKVGQPMTIASDAFPDKLIAGKIVSVSAEATNSRSGNAASFDVRAAFTTDDQALRKAIRIGMSARMTVETYSNPGALIVPPSAVIETGSGRQLQIRRDGQDLIAPVLIGATFPQGVEIVSGVKAGDQLRTRHSDDMPIPTGDTPNAGGIGSVLSK